MILRRLADAIRDQNWFTVVLEVLIVVFGVFIGLQVDGWNQDRKDRAEEQQYLERLHVEALGSIEDQKIDMRWNNTRIRTAGVALDALRSGTLEGDKRQDFARGITFLGATNPLRRRWATISELQSTGNLALLQDIDLRNLIGQIEASFERVNRIWESQDRFMIGHRVYVSRKFEVIGAAGFGADDEVTVDYDFDALVSDPEILHSISQINIEVRQIRDLQEQHLALVERLRDRLAVLLDIQTEGTES